MSNMSSRDHRHLARILTFCLSSAIAVFGIPNATGGDRIVPQKISEDPYSDPLAQHATEVEPVVVAVDNTLVSAFQVGRFFGAGSDNVGWATSKDAGKTWERGFLKGLTLVSGGIWPAVSLPTIAYDKRHKTFIISTMPFDDQGNGRGILVSRSRDGLHWTEPIVAAGSLGTNGHWFACDNGTRSPNYGSCYDAFLDYSSGTGTINALVASRDGGFSWGSPVAAPDQAAGLVTSLAIQPNGNLVILGRNGGPNGDQQYAIRSLNGGATLEATTNITTGFFDFPYMRADPSPSSGVDSDGTIYVVFPDCRFRTKCVNALNVSGCRFITDNTHCPTNDLVMTKSNDGIHWDPIQRIPIDPINSDTDHFITGLGVLSERDDQQGSDHGNSNSHTQLALTYYYLPNGRTCGPTACRIVPGFISSDDGGRTWNHDIRVSDPMPEAWLVPTFAGEMVADYISAVFVNGVPYSAFALARPPDPVTGRFEEAIYAVRLR